MFVLEPEEMKMVDMHTINRLHVSESTLMDNAARAVFDEFRKLDAKTVTVFAGKGNNGADALILASYLARDGYGTKVVLPAGITGMGKPGMDALEILKSIDVDIYEGSTDIDTDVVVDGMFGTGFRGSLPCEYAEAVRRINESGAYVISVDIPSGLDGKSGETGGICVLADMTIAFGAAKTGFFMQDGPKAVGKLVIRDIGFPDEAFDVIKDKRYLATRDMIRKMVPERTIDSNKGDFGKALMIAGSSLMPGAGILCCKAAYKAGAGYVFCITEDRNRDAYLAAVPEAIYETELSPGKYDSIGIGPGMGVNERTRRFVCRALKIGDTNVILDADALNSINDPSIIKDAAARVLITPHPKEMSALTGIPVEEIQKNRMDVCRDFALQHGCVTLLKGYNTVISDEKGNIYINTTGNNSLSKAGTGDVLTGLITGFSAYMDLLDAAVVSAYLHGYCSDIYVRDKSHYSLLASEILEYLPAAMAEAGIR